MHILIVDGHPDRSEERFCHALAAAYAEGARQSGHDVRGITIAKLDIPVLRSHLESD
jgi:putative NADPH-quinone reductase